MPYSNPVVLQGMFNATRNRINPLDAGRARHQENIQNQFRDRQMAAQEQNAATNQQQAATQQKEMTRRLFKDIHEMSKDKRTKTRQEIEDNTSELLYAKEQGPEAWDRMMQKKGKQVPFEEADRLIAPGVGMGNAFKMYQDGADRAAAQKLQETKNKSPASDKRTTLERDVAMLTSGENPMSKEKALEYLNYEKTASPDDVAQVIMRDAVKEYPEMPKEQLMQLVTERINIIQQVKQQREAEDPNNPLGLPRGGGFTGAGVHQP